MDDRVCIYTRVSTKDQTTQNQILDLRRYCVAQGWTVVAECSDIGVSGAQEDRPQLKVAMNLARERKIDVLLVWRFDRFARSLSHLVKALENLRELHVAFVSFQERIDTGTAQGRMLFGIMAAIAEFERSLIVERVCAGLRRAREEGRPLGRPRTAVNVAQALHMRQQGFSLRKIACALSVTKSTVQRRLSQK